MLMNKGKAKAAVAIFVIVLLGILGISRLGGETWISASAGAETGWYAHAGPFTPPPERVYRAFLVPLIMVLAVIAVALLAVILRRYSDRDLAPPRAPQDTAPADD